MELPQRLRVLASRAVRYRLLPSIDLSYHLQILTESELLFVQDVLTHFIVSYNIQDFLEF